MMKINFHIHGKLLDKILITAKANYKILVNADIKYKDVYAGTSDDGNTNYNVNSEKYGDAIYETSSCGSGEGNDWYYANTLFIYPNEPILSRGSNCTNTFGHSLFDFN